MEIKENNQKNNQQNDRKAVYQGVHDMYGGVHNEYSGVTTDLDNDKGNDMDPTVAPGMRDFLEQDANPKEVKKGDYTEVTTLSYDETH